MDEVGLPVIGALGAPDVVKGRLLHSIAYASNGTPAVGPRPPPP